MRTETYNYFVISILSYFFIFSFSLETKAQEDLLKALDSIESQTDFKTLATFKTTRISIGHSIITREAGVLEITSQNRFWNTTEPTSDSFAADRLNSRFELAYGLTDRLTVGAGYGTGYESIDGFFKYRLLYQKDTGSKTPLSVTLFQSIAYREKNPGDFFTRGLQFEEKLGFTSQLLIARKFSSNFSLQISPTYFYRPADGFITGVDAHRTAVGFGGRYKIGNHVSIVSEYYALINKIEDPKSYGAFALGVNWEVADLMLQFNLTNARNLVEDKFIGKTLQNFNFRNGNLHFGFQATYLLHLKKNK